MVGAQLITPEELEAALEKQSKSKLKLGEALVDMGFVSEEQLLPYMQRQLNLPATRLREGMIDPQVVRRIPRFKAEAYHALAMFKVRDMLSVAMSDPQNLQQIDDLERVTELRIRPVFAIRSSIDKMIQRCYEDGFQVDTVTADLDENAVELQQDLVDVDLGSVEALVDGSPIINLVNYFILQAIRQGASDIHIEPRRHYGMVRFRVDGLLREVLRPRRDIYPAIVSRIKVMAKMDIAEHRLPQDGRLHVVVEGREIDLRVSTLPTVLGEKVVLRVLDRRRADLQPRRARTARGHAGRGEAVAGEALRPVAGDRADGERQDDDALLGAGVDQVGSPQHRYGGGSGRVSDRIDQPGSGG